MSKMYLLYFTAVISAVCMNILIKCLDDKCNSFPEFYTSFYTNIYQTFLMSDISERLLIVLLVHWHMIAKFIIIAIHL